MGWIVAAAVVAALGLAWGLSAWRLTRRRQVVVHTRDDSSIRGLMVGAFPFAVVLEHAAYLNEAQPEQFQGRAVIPRSNVSWLQVLDGGK